MQGGSWLTGYLKGGRVLWSYWPTLIQRVGVGGFLGQKSKTGDGFRVPLGGHAGSCLGCLEQIFFLLLCGRGNIVL